MKNKYIHRAKISEKKFRQLLQLFCLDLTASQIADISGINRNTVNRYIAEIRSRISDYCRSDAETSILYPSTCGKRIDHWEEERTSGDIKLVGIVKRNGKIKCQIVSGHTRAECAYLKRARKIHEYDRTIAKFENFNGLIDLGRMKYFKIRTNAEDSDGLKHGIDICEGFWGVARTRLQRFRGLKKSTLMLHIRECEFRYNHNRKKMYPLLLRIIREQPLFS